MAISYHDTWATRSALIKWRGESPPTTVHACLATGSSFTRATPKADFLSAELAATGGYSRKAVTFSSDGTFNNTSKLHEMPEVTVSWTASATLQFQAVFLLADAGLVSETVIGFSVESAPITVYSGKSFSAAITLQEGVGV